MVWLALPDEETVMKQPITLYLIGFAGTGKYTIAKELAKFGYKIIDNHLINNPIFSLLDLDDATPIPDRAWEAIGKIREAVFDFIADSPSANYVFTNVLLEDSDDHASYDRRIQNAKRRGSLFIPIKLHIAPHEHEKRVRTAERKEKFKKTIWPHGEIQKGLIQINHPHLLELDVTDLSAAQAASRIMDFVEEIEDLNQDMTNPHGSSA
jgi:hypothetical protein